MIGTALFTQSKTCKSKLAYRLKIPSNGGKFINANANRPQTVNIKSKRSSSRRQKGKAKQSIGRSIKYTNTDEDQVSHNASYHFQEDLNKIDLNDF